MEEHARSKFFLKPVKNTVLQIMFFVGIYIDTTSACPKRCICYSSIVKCIRSSFLKVPPGIPDTTKELHLSNNNFHHIHPSNFSNLPLLRILELKNNTIQYIVPGSFHRTPKLQYLSLDDNQLTYLNLTTFSGLLELTTLSLNRNPLTSVPFGAFGKTRLTNLRKLKMNSNNINCSCDIVMMNLQIGPSPHTLKARNRIGVGYRKNIDLSCWSGGKEINTYFGTTAMYTQHCKRSLVVAKHNYVQIFGLAFAIIVFCICCCGGCRESRCDCDCQCICIFCVCYNHLQTRIASLCSRIRQDRTTDAEVDHEGSDRPSTIDIQERQGSAISRQPNLRRSSVPISPNEPTIPTNSSLTELSDAPPTYERVMSIVSSGSGESHVNEDRTISGGIGFNNPVFMSDHSEEPPPSYDDVAAQASNSQEHATECVDEERASEADGSSPAVDEVTPTYEDVVAQSSSIVSLPENNDELPPPAYEELFHTTPEADE